MQMHSASETKAVFVGSQRPPPQSPSSFPWIGTLTFPTVMRPRITLSLLLPPTLSPRLPACLSLPSACLPVPFPRGTRREDGRLRRMRFNQRQMRIYSRVRCSRSDSSQWKLCEVHIGDYYIPLGGASDSINLIIPNVSSLWAESSETGTEYTPRRQCLNLESEALLLCSVFAA